MMRRLNTRIPLVAAFIVSLLATQTTRANTVDIVHDGFGAYSGTTFWAAGYYGDEVFAGAYLLNKTGDTGIGDTWANGVVPGLCMELQEPPPKYTYTYDVVMPDDVYNTVTGEVLGVTKANYLRELWALYYDPAWAAGGPYTESQNSTAEAFAAAIWEIVYEKLPVSPAGWDVTVDGTFGLGGFAADNLDAATANKWLHELTGAGPKADLRAFVFQGGQDYLVVVPEPATIVLLGLGAVCSFAGRKRKPARVTARAAGLSRKGTARA